MAQEHSADAESGSIDREEIIRFAAVADKWWQADGPFRALHALNVPRLTYIRDQLCQRHGRNVADDKPLAGINILAAVLKSPMIELETH